MPSESRDFLAEMLGFARRANLKVARISRDDFLADENLCLAVTHLVQIIGDAGAHVPRDAQDEMTDIPWADVIGMRNVLVHDYIGVDFSIVWSVAKEELPKLIQALEDAGIQ